jgi:hypothetical protein
MKLKTSAFIAFLLIGLSPLSADAKLTDNEKKEVKFAFTQTTASEFEASVELKGRRYRFVSFVPDFDQTGAIDRQRALQGWKGDYLFMRHQCGQTTDWRCVVDQVFTRSGDKLVHIGSVESTSCKELGCRYDPETGLFQDLFEIYQVNPISGATDVPPLPIARRVKNNVFVSDLDATWEMNKSSYAASIACLERVAKTGFTDPCERQQSAWSALVYAVKLTHYTGRRAERDALFTTHAVRYCEKSADSRCSWRVTAVQDYYQRFAEGAAPAYEPSPVTTISGAKASAQTASKDVLAPRKSIPLKL